MKRGSVGRIVVVVGVLLALGPQAAVSDQGTATPDQDAAIPDQVIVCPVETDADGNRRWTGQPTSEVAAVADTLQQLADDNPDETSGVAFCSDYSGVEIFVKGESLDVRRAVAQVAAEAPEVPVYTRTVRYSLSDLLDMNNQAMDSHPDVLGAGPDPTLDAVVVQVEAGSQAEKNEILAQRGALTEEIREFVGVDDSSLIFQVGGVGVDSASHVADNPGYCRGAN